MSRISIAAAIAALATAPAFGADVKIGSSAGMTGPTAELVAPVIAGRNLAAAQVNEQGGLFGATPIGSSPAIRNATPRRRWTRRPSWSTSSRCGDHRSHLFRGHERHEPVGDHSGRSGGSVRHCDRALDLRARGQRSRVPGRSFRRLPGAHARTVRLGCRLPEACRHLRERRLQRWPRRGVRGLVRGDGRNHRRNQLHEPDRASYRSELSTLASGGAEGLALFAYYGGSGIKILRNSLENGCSASSSVRTA